MKKKICFYAGAGAFLFQVGASYINFGLGILTLGAWLLLVSYIEFDKATQRKDKKEVLDSTNKLINAIDDCATHIIAARINRDSDAEQKQIKIMESLTIGAQQQLSYLYEYIDENIKCDE